MSGVNHAFYQSDEWKQKRLDILDRDNYLCQYCLKNKNKIKIANTAHHIKHLSDYPELALINSNLISLCKKCHDKEHPEKAAKMHHAKHPKNYRARVIKP